jgi:predicted CoA-binding protein
MTATTDWRAHLVSDEAGVRRVVQASRRVAVLGIKTEAQDGQPAFYVPEYLARAGLDVVPVPVYYPEVKEILGRPVYRRLADVPGELDLVDVFRRPQDLASHVEDLLAKRPRAVWFQSGIRNDAVAEQLARAGIDVVQDRCLMVDHRRYGGSRT